MALIDNYRSCNIKQLHCPPCFLFVSRHTQHPVLIHGSSGSDLSCSQSFGSSWCSAPSSPLRLNGWSVQNLCLFISLSLNSCTDIFCLCLIPVSPPHTGCCDNGHDITVGQLVRLRQMQGGREVQPEKLGKEIHWCPDFKTGMSI